MRRKGHLPIRMCIGCRKRQQKGEMIRFIQTAEGKALFFGGQKQIGRGFYVCPKASCLKAATKRFSFDPSIDIKPFQKDDEGKKAGRRID